MTLWILRVDGKIHTFRCLDDLTAVATVLAYTMPAARLNVKRVRLPAIERKG